MMILQSENFRSPVAGLTKTRRNILISSKAMPVPRDRVVRRKTKPCIHSIYVALKVQVGFHPLLHFDTARSIEEGIGRNDTHLATQNVSMELNGK
jgi:hypothetical protein